MLRYEKIKTMLITITAVTVMAQSTFAADIPVESYPDNATEESVSIAQNLIGEILDEVQNGLGYQPAWCKANNAVFAAVLANETGGYGYADLAAIARNAILQCRDMYLRPEYYAEKEKAVRALISDLINEVKIGATDYKTAEKQAYTRIYQTAEPTFNPDTDCVGDFCYWDMPSIDSALLTQARKLLKNARSRAEQMSITQ